MNAGAARDSDLGARHGRSTRDAEHVPPLLRGFRRRAAAPAASRFGANGYSWRHLLKNGLAGWRAYAIDLKGFGRSAKPLDAAYGMEDQAGLVLDLIEALGLGPVSLVGHSMGGGIALMVALKLMARRQLVDNLVLVDAIAFRQPLPLFMQALRDARSQPGRALALARRGFG
ncbi:MAG: alpha/beta fold hydrolase [Microvirga sp.]